MENNIREIFSLRLKHYMRENEKTRNDLVKDLGFKYSTIRDWEKGITVPRMDKVQLLAEYFNCNNSDLLELKKPEDKTESFKEIESLSPERRLLLENFNKLNEEGQEKLLDLSADLVASGRYIKSAFSEMDSKKA